MAIRQTRFQIKNNQNSAAPFSGATLLVGEPIVNTSSGIMMFSGVTTGIPDWTPAGTGGNANFFEVGSNLYQLKIRDKITSYSGVTNLDGLFLSGTSNGFVLAQTKDLNTFSAFTYSANTFTIYESNGEVNSVTVNDFTGLTINGNFTVTGTETVNDLTITGTGLYNTTATGTNPNEIVNYSSLTGFSLINDVYVTGNTLTPATDFTNTQQALLEYHGTPIGGPYVIDTLDTFTTGGTYDNNTFLITFDRNDGTTGYTVDLSSLDINDTFVTGFTYNPSNNTFTISRNEGEPDITASINTVSGLTVSNLTAGRIVYVGTGGLLTDEAGFKYDESTNTFAVENIEAAGNVTIQGDLTVLGAAISAFTSNLYVEDSNVTLNYNPTGGSASFSVNAGLTIQDGNGISGGSVNFDIIQMLNLTGLTPTEIPIVSGYNGLNGYENRGFITQLNDIVIRSTDVTDTPLTATPGAINGVRVLAEFDVLDGGTY